MLLGLSPQHPAERAKTSGRKKLVAGQGWFRAGGIVPQHGAPILLGGAPRTGTSWTAKVLSQGYNVRYIREPVSHGQFHEGYYPTVPCPYLLEGESAPDYSQVWRRALSLSSMVSKRWLMSESRPLIRRVPFWPARLLVKEVNCPLALEWLSETFGFRIVSTIRHPCGFVSSGLRLLKQGYTFVTLEPLLAQRALVGTYFAEDYDWLSQLDTPLARLAGWYGMVYKVLADQFPRHPDWILVQHEAFCRNPKAQFSRLFQALALRFSGRVERFLTATSHTDDGNLYSVYRNSAQEPDKWKHELTPAQIDEVASIIERFHLPYYREFA
jgi:hypothetical protein